MGETLGSILSKTEKVLLEARPDAVLVLGYEFCDFRHYRKTAKIPVFHMEAGNGVLILMSRRVNRKIVDHIDFNLVYTEHARRHLVSEGIPHNKIFVTGSPMRELIAHATKSIEMSEVLSSLNLEAGSYVVASLHREENRQCNETCQLIERLRLGCRQDRQGRHPIGTSSDA